MTSPFHNDSMIEPLCAITFFVLLWFGYQTTHALLENKVSLWPYFVYALFGAAGLYCLVRLIHWSWETPMPFTQ